MMALAAKDASFTSAPNLQGPSLTPNNIIVQEFWEIFNLTASFNPLPTPVLLAP